MFKKILYATDLSEASIKALEFTEDIAKRNNSSVLILTVISEELTAENYYVPNIADVLQKIQSETEKRLDQFIKDRFKGLTVEKIISRGRPYEEIVRISNERAVDLIVIGTHGRTGLSHVILGSVAMRVLRRATQPVLVVRSK